MRERSKAPLSRVDHPKFDKHGACTRCGISPGRAATCPPGFWMTPEETRVWDSLYGGRDAQREYEIQLIEEARRG